MSTHAEDGAGSAPPAAAGQALQVRPAAPPQRLDEVVRSVKLELITDRSARRDRGSGFDPYDCGAARDVWGRRRRA